ncbi:hypothetical protein [Aliivibrio salmonicida]|uniref:hypothetical protein n=1 Tax=Aliivibrio salmonicida TaxID=40269 RepID=UPI003D0A568F
MNSIQVMFKRSKKKEIINFEVNNNKGKDFKVSYESISDKEAVKIANSFPYDKKEFGNKIMNKRNYPNNHAIKTVSETKENRVPGLYGCNRYKSNVNNSDRSFS